MKVSLLTKLCCPVDKRPLQHQVFLKTPEDDIIEGLLSCPECLRYYPIIYGIPVMTPDEYRQKALEAPMLEKWGLEADVTAYRLLGE